MSRVHFSGILISITTFSVAAFFLACGGGSNNPGRGGPGSPSGPGVSGVGGFAAGIGGAGQTSSAHFLVAIQVPGGTPTATVINSNGTLTAAKVSVHQHTEPNPEALSAAIDPTGSFLYQAVWPGLWAFTIDRQTGNLTEMSASPYNDTENFEAVAVDQLGKFVYAYAAGRVFAYSIQAGTGQLTPIAGSPFPALDSGEQFAIASDRLAVSQDNKYLYVATGSGIFAFSISASTGALTVAPGSPFGGSAGQAFAIVAPSSGFLYETINGHAAPIFGYSIDQNSGALTPIAGSPFGPNCNGDNLTSPANGKFLFAAGCGMYQINGSTGALTFSFQDPTAPGGSWAVFDPASAFLWILQSLEPCFHCEIGVTAFQVDANSGNLTMVPNSFFSMTNSEVGDIQSLAITH